MKVNFGKQFNNEPRTGTRETQGRVFIAPNLKKESVMLDRFGNQIDPRTKQIISRADSE